MGAAAYRRCATLRVDAVTPVRTDRNRANGISRRVAAFIQSIHFFACRDHFFVGQVANRILPAIGNRRASDIDTGSGRPIADLTANRPHSRKRPPSGFT